MNKSDKMRLYGQKDYTELIEFPVELVGKDGVVRRYTYEESLLVYAKRIESAHLRYRDPDVADAEVDHCYKRIEQIKRSWKHVSSRRVETNADYAVRYEESAAAECRAFIREYFGKALADRIAPDEEPIPIYLSLVQHTGPLKVFHVSLANRKGSHLLYAFTFAWEPETEEEPGARAQFADWSRILASNPDGGDDVERLLAAREGKEFGHLLTGPYAATIPNAATEAEEPSPGLEPAAPARGTGGGAARARVQALLEEDPGNAEAHYAMGVLAANEGDAADALEHFEKCVELQPWFKDAYRRIAVLGDQLSRHDDVEPYILQANHYFPEDDRMQFQLGLLRVRQARYDDAKTALRRALAIDPANRRAAWLLDLVERSLKKGADPRIALAAWKPSAILEDGAVPSRLAVFALALGITLALAVHSLEPMAGAFVFSAILAVLVVASARASAHVPPRIP